MGIPEGEESEQEIKNLFEEIMSKNFLNLVKEKDTETIKKDQLEIKNAISEINNTLEGIKSRLYEAENQISDLEDKGERNTQAEQQKGKGILNNE